MTAYDAVSHQHLRGDYGTIVKIEVFSNVSEKRIPKLLFPIYKQFRKYYEKIHGEYPIGEFLEDDEKFKGIKVNFYINQTLVLKKGDKLNNRHFNKGVISVIEKPENMPVTPWGERIQMIYNPLAIANRMITGQLMEGYCGLISKYLFKEMEKSNRKNFLSLLKMVLPLLDGTKDKMYSTSVIKYFSSISDEQYNKIIQGHKTKNYEFFPIIVPPFYSPKRENILEALKVCGLKPAYPLYLPKYGRKTNPVSVGYIYVNKLEHISEKKIHTRSTGTYKQSTLTPVAGKKRGGGQQFGEYETYSLLAWDCPIILDEFHGPLSSDHVTKNEMISEIIKTGETTFRYAKTDPVRETFTALMLAIHVKTK